MTQETIDSYVQKLLAMDEAEKDPQEETEAKEDEPEEPEEAKKKLN
jgi:hypothetical protein